MSTTAKNESGLSFKIGDIVETIDAYVKEIHSHFLGEIVGIKDKYRVFIRCIISNEESHWQPGKTNSIHIDWLKPAELPKTERKKGKEVIPIYQPINEKSI